MSTTNHFVIKHGTQAQADYVTSCLYLTCNCNV